MPQEGLHESHSDSRAPQAPWPSTQSPLFRPQDVIRVSKKFLPGMAVGYSSSKLTLHVGDGFEFMKQNQDAFDVIITDSSDPMGKRGVGRDPPAAAGAGANPPGAQHSVPLSCHVPLQRGVGGPGHCPRFAVGWGPGGRGAPALARWAWFPAASGRGGFSF